MNFVCKFAFVLTEFIIIIYLNAEHNINNKKCIVNKTFYPYIYLREYVFLFLNES